MQLHAMSWNMSLCAICTSSVCEPRQSLSVLEHPVIYLSVTPVILTRSPCAALCRLYLLFPEPLFLSFQFLQC